MRFCIVLLVLLLGCSSASASPTAKMVCGVVADVVSALFKWLVSLKSETETANLSRWMMKFERGYDVETIFDGNKLGVEPYSVVVSPGGEAFVLDSENSNLYSISTPLSLYSRPELVTGSPQGCSGHIDGNLRDARMNHPKGLAIDDNGNVYVADTMNMAIRKITRTGVVTIAGGKRFQGERNIDAKLSNDFDLVYVRTSCSLLVVDRGNRAIKEIQLQKHDCSYQYFDSNLLGAALLFAACFFGYTLAVLQRKIGAIFPSNRKTKSQQHSNPKKRERYLFVLVVKLLINIASNVLGIFGGILFGSRKKHLQPRFQQNLRYTHKQSSSWSYAVDNENDLQPRTSKHMHIHKQKQSSNPQTFTEQSSEVVFGEIQEQSEYQESVVIKTIDYSDPAYNHYNIRSRYSCNNNY